MSKTIKSSLFIIIVALLIIMGAVVFAAWQEPPPGGPPTGNVPALINVSNVGQTKAGDLCIKNAGGVCDDGLPTAATLTADILVTTGGALLNTSGATPGLIVQSGKVGIGTTDPVTNLQVSGSGGVAIGVSSSDNQAAITLASDDAGPVSIYSPTGSDDLRFFLNTADRLVIQPSGYVGVGIVSPSAALDVQPIDPTNPTFDILKLRTSNLFAAAQQYALTFRMDGAAASIKHDSPTAGLILGANNRFDITILGPTGNVGIGTIAPKNRLDVEGGMVVGTNYSGLETAAANGLLVEGNVGIGTVAPGAKLEVNGQIKITGGSPGASKVLTSDAGGLASWQTVPGGLSGGTANYVPLWTSPTTQSISAIYQDAVGNIGIGTLTPLTKIHILASNEPSIRIQDSDTGEPQLNLSTLTNRVEIGSILGHPLDLRVGGITNAIRIDSAGDVSIGGLADPKSKLEVKGDIRMNTAGVLRPACDADHRGAFWFTFSPAGANDVLEICARNNTNVFGWRPITIF